MNNSLRVAPNASLICALVRSSILMWWLLASPAYAQQSVCFGTVSNGRLEHGMRLPDNGPNFSAYTGVASALGRNYVHSKVHAIILDAYDAALKTMPDVVFVYGETGWKKGGRIRPHRTHQNGLSVDFMVPVRDKEGKSVPLPTSALNKYGYEIEFDHTGRYTSYRIDYSALAEHLFQLKRAAIAQGADISRVIFDPQFMPRLFDTARGPYLKKHVTFMKGKPWVRHDEHYHVDFAVRCESMSK
jgi:penicillin-insensitive murein endopeptidase